MIRIINFLRMEFGWTDAPLERFFLTCSQQQLVVPQGIRGQLSFRLAAPDTLRPQTSRCLQAYHTQRLASRMRPTLTIFVPGGEALTLLFCVSKSTSTSCGNAKNPEPVQILYWFGVACNPNLCYTTVALDE